MLHAAEDDYENGKCIRVIIEAPRFLDTSVWYSTDRYRTCVTVTVIVASPVVQMEVGNKVIDRFYVNRDINFARHPPDVVPSHRKRQEHTGANVSDMKRCM